MQDGPANITRGASAEWSTTVSPEVSIQQQASNSSGSSGFGSRGSSPLIHERRGDDEGRYQEVTFRPLPYGYEVRLMELGAGGYRREVHYYQQHIPALLAPLVAAENGPPLDFFGYRFVQGPDGCYQGIYFQSGINGRQEQPLPPGAEDWGTPLDLSQRPGGEGPSGGPPSCDGGGGGPSCGPA